MISQKADTTGHFLLSDKSTLLSYYSACVITKCSEVILISEGLNYMIRRQSSSSHVVVNGVDVDSVVVGGWAGGVATPVAAEAPADIETSGGWRGRHIKRTIVITSEA